MKGLEEETLRLLYNSNIELYQRVCVNIKDALIILLNNANVPFLAVTSRVKHFNSFYDKVKSKGYANPFADNEDFCGTRIILYHLDDIEKVKNIITEEFDIQKNEDKTKKLGINEFGYRSHHFIVKFKREWASTPNYKGLNDLKIEIQVRTILMHAWAEIEHKLGYKNEAEVPEHLTRKMFLLSAKLEEADGQFQDLRKNIENYEHDLVSKAKENGEFSSADFNLNTFQALLDYYFPELKRDRNDTQKMYIKILEYKLKVEQIAKYAEMIKPHIGSIEQLINSKYKASQTNIMSYAIEAFYPNADLKSCTKSRIAIIKKIKEMS